MIFNTFPASLPHPNPSPKGEGLKERNSISYTFAIWENRWKNKIIRALKSLSLGRGI
jgi:hypothetical protein